MNYIPVVVNVNCDDIERLSDILNGETDYCYIKPFAERFLRACKESFSELKNEISAAEELNPFCMK